MRAAVYDKTGGPEVFHDADVPGSVARCGWEITGRRLDVVIDSVLPRCEASAAHRHIESREARVRASLRTEGVTP